MPTLPRLLALALAVPLAAPLGCASDKYGPPPTAWDTNAPSTPASTGPAPSTGGTSAPGGTGTAGGAKGDGTKRTAAEVAAGKRDALTCIETAERLGGDQGLAVLRECMHRGDFLDLARAVKEPWLPRMRTSAPMQARIVEVIARRGGYLERDVPLLARGKLPIRTLDEAVAAPKTGELVIARGTVDAVASEKWGKGKGLVATIAETTWIDDDAPQGEGGVPEIVDIEITQAQRTGRTFYVRVENKDQLKRAAEVVLLMTVEGPRSAKNEDDEEVASLIGFFVTASTASPTLRE